MTLQKIDDKFIGEDGHQIVPLFEHYSVVSMYEQVGLKGYAPMTAKELDTEEAQDSCLNSKEYFVEEKFDGTRALLYFLNEKPLKHKNLGDREFKFRQCLLRGSGFVGGKQRIYEFFVSHTPMGERCEFLKKEFGIGGGSITFHDNTNGFVMYSSRGYEVKYSDNSSEIYLWSAVADRLSQMISAGEFYSNEAYTRCFSRRVSEKTGWYCENTDSLPHLRGLCIPELKDTILDGEMFIPNRPFKDVSSTLNCKWDKAIDRQLELGFIVFHAFDILFYKGIDLRKMPLNRRKVYLQLVINRVNSSYVQMVSYQKCGDKLSTLDYEDSHGTPYTVCRSLEEIGKGESYPFLYAEYKENPNTHSLSPRAFYEYVVATGGEGVMVKPITGKYYHKRGWEYSKIKKFLTREVIIMGFTPPTKEYAGKFPNDSWEYWVDSNDVKQDSAKCASASADSLKNAGLIPVTKYYYENWVGTIRFGVIITLKEIEKLPKSKKFNIEERVIENTVCHVLEVGECSGFDEPMRQLFSCNAIDPDGVIIRCEDGEEIDRNDLQHYSWENSVIEIKANEIFRDTGKLRHPRFLRTREDKSPLECTYADHIAE